MIDVNRLGDCTMSRRSVLFGGLVLGTVAVAPLSAFAQTAEPGNGYLAGSQLTALSVGGQLLTSAAASFETLAAAFKSATGRILAVASTYRPYADQLALFNKRYTRTNTGRSTKNWDGVTYWLKPNEDMTAVPGTSNHGWGIAIDVASCKPGSSTFAWLSANGPALGWTNTEGRAAGESWHWVCVSAPPPPSTPATQTGPISIMEDDVARLMLHPNGTVALIGPGPRMVILRTATEMDALRATGQIDGDLIVLPNPLIWDTCAGIASRAGTYTA